MESLLGANLFETVEGRKKKIPSKALSVCVSLFVRRWRVCGRTRILINEAVIYNSSSSDPIFPTIIATC